MTFVRRLAALTSLVFLGAVAPASATLLVKSDSTGLLVQDKNGIGDKVIITSGTQGGNPVYVVTNNNDFDVFKFDFQANCSQGATSDKAVCKRISGKLNLAMAGGDDKVNVSSSGANVASANLGGAKDAYQGIGGPDDVFGASGDDTIDTRGGADDIQLGSGADKVIAGSGADEIEYATFETFDAADEVDAGSGNDHVNLDRSGRDARVEAGSGDDAVLTGFGDDAVFGDPGDDTILTGGGDDRAFGGDDADEIDTGRGADEVTTAELFAPSVADDVKCGEDHDSVLADLMDVVSAISDPRGGTCEEVDRRPIGETPQVKMPAKTLRVAANGRVRVRLRCPRGVKKLGCKGRLRLALARKRKGGVQTSRSRRVRYKIRAGKRKTVVLRLTKKDVRTLRRNKRRGKATRGILVSVEKGRIGPKTTVRNPRLKLRGR
jgi:RTX calcium-binding nonapeptide repeat (4 copies)